MVLVPRKRERERERESGESFVTIIKGSTVNNLVSALRSFTRLRARERERKRQSELCLASAISSLSLSLSLSHSAERVAAVATLFICESASAKFICAEWANLQRRRLFNL